MPNVISRSFNIDELIELHVKSRTKLIELYKTLKSEGWSEEVDARIIPVKLLMAGVDSKLIILLLIKENFADSNIWNSFKIENPEDKPKVIEDKLYFILGDLKDELYTKMCMQLEHFIRIVAGFININNSSINTLTKQFINEIGLDAEFKNLIDLINYIRNTIHFGGIHTKNDTIVTYKLGFK